MVHHGHPETRRGNQDETAIDDGANDAPPMDFTLPITDEEIVTSQKTPKFVQKLVTAESYKDKYGLVTVNSEKGWRVVLPPTLWPAVFKEMHGSDIYVGLIPTDESHNFTGGQDFNENRKDRPREVIPPLWSMRGGDVGGRWALYVAGPFPIANCGERYVIAAVEYVKRYAVARSVHEHTAKRVTTFLMEDIVLKFGAFRELLTDGAPEMGG
ncbi:Uncharacterized protein PHPALM_12209 [Phytophthora palmivora]|uniref:Integrase catalytic domain-containing protein n=1 Tax=Phytophthora palmivora TaxID=4796 RepID=A0A2P4Y0C4_9STRA|nr:Uncharacterized protein PHPALM_12209 [Phytophthora palmivora]